MIEKKDPRVNLERYRATIFGIGLLAAGSFTLAAFTYTSPLEVEQAKIASFQTDVAYEVQQVPPKEEPKIVEETHIEEVEEFTTEVLPEASEISKSKENTDQQSKTRVSSGKQDRKFSDIRVKVRKKKVSSAPVEFPDVEAAYVGGYKELATFVQNTQVYPDIAIHKGDQGTAYVRFIVEKDGSVSNVNATGNVSRALKKEAERVVKKSPKWIPGEVGGKRVRCIVRLPITFVLD